MTSDNPTSDTLEARQLSVMNQAFATAPFHQHYLSRVAYRPLTLDGLSLRVQEAFGNGALYDHRWHRQEAEEFLVFLPDQSIPSHLVRQSLQTVALDRVVAETIRAESVLAAKNYCQSARWGFAPELRRIAQTSPTVETVQAAHVAITRGLTEIPGYRDQVGVGLMDQF